MGKHQLTDRKLNAFEAYLKLEERSAGTVEKYLRDVGNLQTFLGGEPVTKEAVVAWKEHLRAAGYAAVTVNSMVVAANRFFRFCGWEDCRVKTLRLQRRTFRDSARELTREEYFRLMDAAQRTGRQRLGLLMETICATGIRVSEVAYITVEAAQAQRVEVSLKGKIRTILLPGKLCRRLLKYAQGKKITSGQIFLTRGGTPISRRQIWAEMKSLCETAGVASGKVFPHNLRHLFATSFYRVCRDIVKLADVLGHASVETTRIYLLTAGEDHQRALERLGLVV